MGSGKCFISVTYYYYDYFLPWRITTHMTHEHQKGIKYERNGKDFTLQKQILQIENFIPGTKINYRY
jgi:hypothetical protein